MEYHDDCNDDALNFCFSKNIWNDEIDVNFGKATPRSGELAFNSLKRASDALKKEEIDVLVTARINKASIQEKVPGFIGHTEFL